MLLSELPWIDGSTVSGSTFMSGRSSNLPFMAWDNHHNGTFDILEYRGVAGASAREWRNIGPLEAQCIVHELIKNHPPKE